MRKHLSQFFLPQSWTTTVSKLAYILSLKSGCVGCCPSLLKRRITGEEWVLTERVRAGRLQGEQYKSSFLTSISAFAATHSFTDPSDFWAVGKSLPLFTDAQRAFNSRNPTWQTECQVVLQIWHPFSQEGLASLLQLYGTVRRNVLWALTSNAVPRWCLLIWRK